MYKITSSCWAKNVKSPSVVSLTFSGATKSRMIKNYVLLIKMCVHAFIISIGEQLLRFKKMLHTK